MKPYTYTQAKQLFVTSDVTIEEFVASLLKAGRISEATAKRLLS